MNNQSLAEIVAAPAATPDEAVSKIRNIDEILDKRDGLRWFNLLYLMVTTAVLDTPPPGGWLEPDWVSTLNVSFANLYFDAVRKSITDRAAPPKAWKVLFSVRNDQRIMRVQFALCGMNAHINRDLPFALVQTAREKNGFPPRDSREHADFEHVNGVLEQVEQQAIEKLATGIVGEIAEDLGDLDDILAMWGVRQARETAWTNARILWELGLDSLLGQQQAELIDSFASFAGRGLIVHI